MSYIFDLINHLHSENDCYSFLTAREQILLIKIVNAIGNKEEWYHSYPKLAQMGKISVRHAIKFMNKFVANNILLKKTSYKNHYQIHPEFIQNISNKKQKTVTLGSPCQEGHRDPRVTLFPKDSDPGDTPTVTHGSPLYKEEKSKRKVKEQKSNARKRASLSLISFSFFPKPEHYELGRKKGMDKTMVNNCTAKFIEHYMAKGVQKLDWDLSLSEWLENERVLNPVKVSKKSDFEIVEGFLRGIRHFYPDDPKFSLKKDIEKKKWMNIMYVLDEFARRSIPEGAAFYRKYMFEINGSDIEKLLPKYFEDMHDNQN